MRLRTHVLASPAFYLVGMLVAGRPPAPEAFLTCALGSVLPEVDKPDSLVGRAFPLSSWIHERFGHRGLTHSLLGLLSAMGLFAPLALISFDLWLGLLIGYLSHLFLDMATLEGVPLLWPKRTRHVFPGREELRLDQAAPGAGRKEAIIGVFFLALAGGLWPLSQVGLPGAVRRAFGTLEGTLPEYQKLAPSYEVFLTGTLMDVITGVKRTGEWRIIAAYGDGYLVEDQGRVRLVSPSGDLVPIKVNLRHGEPISIVVHDLPDFRGPIQSLLSYLDPKLEHYVSGKLLLTENVSVTFPPGVFPTVAGERELTLTFARLSDLQGILDRWAEAGALTIVHRLRKGEALSPALSPPSSQEAVEVRFRVASFSELYVREGSEVVEGELLGRSSSPELLRKRAEVDLARERFAAGLIPEVELRKLEAELALLEAAHEVRAKVSGRVLSVRILSMDQDGLEVSLRLLPQAPSETQKASSEESTAPSEKRKLPYAEVLPEIPCDQGEKAQVWRVIDGDTVELLYMGRVVKARLVGVDTPETKDPRKPVECFGPEAARFTSTTLPRGTEARITWNPLGKREDRYGRLLVYLWIQLDEDGPFELFNAALIRLGYARVYPFFKFDRFSEFRRLEALALAEKRGLWGDCGYEPYR